MRIREYGKPQNTRKKWIGYMGDTSYYSRGKNGFAKEVMHASGDRRSGNSSYEAWKTLVSSRKLHGHQNN